MKESPIAAKVQAGKPPRGTAAPRPESHVGVSFSAPFALRCGALLRNFIGYPVALLPFGLGFLIVTVNPSGRALHDLIAGTIVVREHATPMVAPARRSPAQRV